MKVVKFGGTSMAGADQIIKACNIVLSDPSRKYMIVSAPGKCFDSDIKITDLLIKCANLKSKSSNYDTVFKSIMDKFNSIINDLHIDDTLLFKLESDLNDRLNKKYLSDSEMFDNIKAFGENSSAIIVNSYFLSKGINSKYVNPGDYGLVLDGDYGNGRVHAKSFDHLSDLKNTDSLLIIPGFFGHTHEGNVITFSRGGSDITGSIIAASINADCYENFTDVDSVFVTDPRIIKNPKPIENITYKEMRELSYAGFSVLHEETIEPLYRKKIPIIIKNTNNPSSPGTMISNKKIIDTEYPVTGIACESGFSTISIKKYMMNREIGFGRKVLQILEDENISFEHTPSGIDDFSIILTSKQLTPKIESILTEKIFSKLNVDDISIEHNKALAMIVGEGIMDYIGIAGRACLCLSNNNINLEMINQGSSRVSIMLGIKDCHREKAIKALYLEFFNK